MLLSDKLHKWSVEGILLKCLDKKEVMSVLVKVHKGICGSYRSGPKMRWLIYRHGYYWLTMETDYINYAKGCIACQQHGLI